MKSIPLFPTHIWLVQSDEVATGLSNDAICKYLDQKLQPRPQLQPGRSWQTEQNLHQLPFFESLMAHFIERCEQVLDQLQVVHEGIVITGCWANISPPGSLHTPHTHPNNFLSGVFYPSVQQGSNAILFHKQGGGQASIDPGLKGLNEFNASEVAIELQVGSLVIFPSGLMHSVPPNRSTEDRFSISFNIMFDRFTEVVSPPKWQGIPLKP